MRGNRDLSIAAWGSIVCALAALFAPWPALSLVFAAPLTLFAPGYAIVAATFARRPLDRHRVALLSLALSLAALAIGSFVLNYVPGGVRDVSWAILLPLATVACCRAAALRRHQPLRFEWRKPAIGGRNAAFALGGLALAAAALVLAMTTLPADNARGFTQLWVTPGASGARASAEVGVGSDEQHKASYVLRTHLGSDSQPVVRRFTLQPGESREIRLFAVPSPDGAPVPVRARLYRRDRPGRVYREVFAWIPGTAR